MTNESVVISDEDARSSVLRRAGLRIGDPRAQESLVERVPEGVEPDGILNRYEFREEKVRCAVCPNRQPHNIGITISLPDGTKALCGSDCAEQLYGHDVWQRLDLDLKAREREVILRDVVRPLGALIKRIRGIANPWYGVSANIGGFLDDLRDLAPGVVETMVDAVRRRDSQLEGPDGQVVHVVAGGGCLLEDAQDVLKVVGEQAREAEDLLAGNVEKIEVLERLSRLKGDLRSGLMKATDLMAAGQQFVQPDNLRAIVHWVNLTARKGGRFKVKTKDGDLILEIETKKSGVWEVPVPSWPDELSLPSTQEIIRLFE